MTISLVDIRKNDNQWYNIVEDEAALGTSDSVSIQNREREEIAVFFGGASAPSSLGGIILARDDLVTGASTSIWVRALQGNDGFKIGVTYE